METTATWRTSPEGLKLSVHLGNDLIIDKAGGLIVLGTKNEAIRIFLSARDNEFSWEDIIDLADEIKHLATEAIEELDERLDEEG